MDEHIYKQIELTGSSKKSMEDAIQNAITKAGETLRNIHWFQVTETLFTSKITRSITGR